MPAYDPAAIEHKWQRFWEEKKTFRTPDTSDKPKFYILDMFPYPSGAGLHVGHPEGYTATDILARYQRQRGRNVLHPMGWDAFGLPAEQYAIETGTHPRETTQHNINTFRRQIKSLGFSYDWDREVDTTDPNYFKWTQWIFLVLFDTWFDQEAQKGRSIAELPIPNPIRNLGEPAVRLYQDQHRLAYQAEIPVNWCPALGTVLANEEVVDGKSERGGHPVVRMPLRQWMLRITAYAERLLDDLTLVEWSEAIKEMQRNWIGRSEGAEVDFRLQIEDCRLTESDNPTNLQSAICNLQCLRVFTTRPDTLFGATYMVLAPEHPLVDEITTSEQRAAVAKYKTESARKSDLERTELAKTKTGVFTGAYAINPVNNEKIPIWIADYVLFSYGTGAIMAVPAHDERDFEFARQFNLPIRPVVMPPVDWLKASNVCRAVLHMSQGLDQTFEEGPGEPGRPDKSAERIKTIPREVAVILVQTSRAWEKLGGDLRKVLEFLYLNHLEFFNESFTGEGVAVNSGAFDGMPSAEFKKKITVWLEAHGLGAKKVNYKLRDWLFSRQRYWGEPFPILHEVNEKGERTGVIEPLTLDDLPLELPEMADYKPSGRPEPPLGKATDWVNVVRHGKKYQRETNTMPQWAGSCWYYLRYLDPKNSRAFCGKEKERTWMPVDLYVGGAEHAVLHLLYSRFWHKVLFDRGHVSTPEPFMRLVNQGMILGEMEFTLGDSEPGGVRRRLTEEEVEKRGDRFFLKTDTSVTVDARAYKMSKSRGNVINPDKVIAEYGADSMRLYEMFMGPLEATKPWSMRGVEGVYRFLSRVWRLLIDDRADTMKLNPTVQDIPADKDTLRKLHQTIKKVTEDLDGLRFNTAIAAMMELTNHLTKLEPRPRCVFDSFILILSPFAPHLAEELWQTLGHPGTLAYEPWPKFDEAFTKANEIEVPVQVNGKLRSKVTVPADADAKALEAAALADERIKELLVGKTEKKVIVVPGKLVNIVVG